MPPKDDGEALKPAQVAVIKRWIEQGAVGPKDEKPGADPREYGDYEGLAVGNSVAHPVWTDSRDLGSLAEEIYTTTLTMSDFGG